MLLCNTIVLQF